MSVCGRERLSGSPPTAPARWADKREIRRAGLLKPDGVLLGRWQGEYLRHDGLEHVLWFRADKVQADAARATILAVDQMLSDQPPATSLKMRGLPGPTCQVQVSAWGRMSDAALRR